MTTFSHSLGYLKPTVGLRDNNKFYVTDQLKDDDGKRLSLLMRTIN